MGSRPGGCEPPSIRRRSEESGTKPSTKRGGAAYQGALEAVFAVPVGVGIGYFVDRTFETFPTFLLVGAGVGFAAFVLRLWRLGRDLQESEGSDGGTEQNR
ncbi:MAG: AtpZ/AtpI family protein [Myxococcota bacterium]